MIVRDALGPAEDGRDQEADGLPLKPWLPTLKYGYVEITLRDLPALPARRGAGASPAKSPSGEHVLTGWGIFAQLGWEGR